MFHWVLNKPLYYVSKDSPSPAASERVRKNDCHEISEKYKNTFRCGVNFSEVVNSNLGNLLKLNPSTEYFLGLFSKFHNNFPGNIYLFKSNNIKLEKGVKYA